ncbi:hypothetical protein EP517_12920 [Salmonella enterica]|uniref:Uncharacterized protein n=1 Tax=Salmonella enterica TaxID=28901 RepID=A0A603L1K6_SALER|nr:hypothetical protein [Salmonella enterica subsp. salamae]EAM3923877.1 hypothetical protein [Salmonella enterica]ESE66813.1 hypothetical protein SES60163_06746 [Salmonella enterica subsp. salamae serovar 58:l,z13,z28:z6 str. 00-0163]EAN9125260.1 hypothetical protein [Salmonella enterica]EAR5415111.1 hypothetical protein [Salmonella enterica]
MSYVDDNVRLLTGFNQQDSRTVATMKEYVLPWAKERLIDLQKLYQITEEPMLTNEINMLRDGIRVCEERLKAA